ncbi:MAG: transglutaminase [Deltaproteobacteria bacterium]|jgi:transglutaminase-like putative cysteine protease|nr:transglutaminase [Deltaproteobacteria bacterium]MBW2534564.1 transglutaminase [Deltaproteobacteria bacterium]
MASKGAGGRKGKVAGWAVGLLLKVLWTAFVITTPVLGVWGASSIAAYQNGPVWLVMLSGLLLFPILPVAWDLLSRLLRARRVAKRQKAADRAGRGKVKAKSFLTWYDRLILRTLAVNLLFIGVLLGTHPMVAFEALSARGDWFLEGRTGPTADAWRGRLYWAADRLEWLYVAVKDNPFRDQLEHTDVEPPDPGQAGEVLPRSDATGERPSEPSARPSPSTSASAEPAPSSSATADAGEVPTPDEPADDPASRQRRWPLLAELHPAVRSIPEDAEKSLESVGEYLASQEQDTFFRVKAVHDYVADRVAYDAPAYVEGRYPPQDAATVFRTGTGVCAGYANLAAAMGRAADLEIVVVGGDSRDEQGGISGGGHAWNAVKVDGGWYLMDVTWDSGTVSGRTFKKGYRTTYLYTPPKVFGVDHLPDNPRWQLRDEPLSRGDFIRQPMMSTRFFEFGLELLQPDRSQVTVASYFELVVRNPRSRELLVDYVPLGSRGQGERECSVEGQSQVRGRCQFEGDGQYEVRLLAITERTSNSWTGLYVGKIQVNVAQ